MGQYLSQHFNTIKIRTQHLPNKSPVSYCYNVLIHPTQQTHILFLVPRGVVGLKFLGSAYRDKCVESTFDMKLAIWYILLPKTIGQS